MSHSSMGSGIYMKKRACSIIPKWPTTNYRFNLRFFCLAMPSTTNCQAVLAHLMEFSCHRWIMFWNFVVVRKSLDPTQHWLGCYLYRRYPQNLMCCLHISAGFCPPPPLKSEEKGDEVIATNANMIWESLHLYVPPIILTIDCLEQLTKFERII